MAQPCYKNLIDSQCKVRQKDTASYCIPVTELCIRNAMLKTKCSLPLNDDRCRKTNTIRLMMDILIERYRNTRQNSLRTKTMAS